MFIELPKDVLTIIETLEAAGYEAYAVGGCVRDSVLGRTPNDWDITTNAKPLETKALFKRTFDTGIAHGTVSVLLQNNIYEVTTYRIDGEYEDARHPKEVVFTKELKEDLLRRDFTINAMAYNPKVGLVDIYGGMSDIEKKVIRTVGNPMERFSEDALRMMRAIRFAAQLDYSVCDETKEAIKILAPNLSKISAERIQVELVKTIISDHPDYFRMAYELGMTAVFMPELDIMMNTDQNNRHHCYTVGEHSIQTMCHIRPDKVLRLAALLHDMGKPAAKVTDENGVDHFHNHPEISADISRKILRRLKFDNDTIDRVSELARYHDWTMEVNSKTSVRRAINRIGERNFPDIFELNRADVMAQSDYKRDIKLEHISNLLKIYEEIKAKDQCVSIKSLALNGKDIIGLGVESGPSIGFVLNAMLEYVLDDPALNNKETLIKLYYDEIRPKMNGN